MKKVLITANSSFAIWNFRKRLVEIISEENFVHIAIPTSDLDSEKNKNNDIPSIKFHMNSTSKSIFSNLISIFDCFKIIVKHKPDVVLSFTIKNNIFFGIVCRFLRIKFIPNITGVGSFEEDLNFLQLLLIKPLYRLSMRGADHIFFQNSNDRDFFIKSNYVTIDKSTILPGSGIDLLDFKYIPIDCNRNKEFTFLFASRLLIDKGAEIFINAAILLSQKYKDVRFLICGENDKNDSRYIDQSVLEQIDIIENIEYLGNIKSIKKVISESSCIVLPSLYNEGVPRILIESLAIGRPIITTNRPGCLETIEIGTTGFFVENNNVRDLCNQMIKMINKNSDEISIMSESCRRLAEHKFSDEVVISQYLSKI